MPKVEGHAAIKCQRNLEFYQTAPEISVFMVCYAMRNSLLELERDWRSGKITKDVFSKKFRSTFRQMAGAADATHRFDIVMPVLPRTWLTAFSPFFWRWFNWWEDYLDTLRPGTLLSLQRMCADGIPGVERYRPPGDWLTYRKTPSFTVTVDP